jgi:hypothetical protein
VELRILDPGGQDLAFTWQILDGHGHLLASGQVAGAPNTPQLAGWRYHAFTDAAHAAITALLQHLEATQRPPSPGGRARTCDFCAATPAAWRYPVWGGQLAPVLIGEVLVVIPGGDWYACPACRHLVEAGQWDTLSERARLPQDRGAALWASFQTSRAGAPILLDPQAPKDHGQAEDERGRP